MNATVIKPLSYTETLATGQHVEEWGFTGNLVEIYWKDNQYHVRVFVKESKVMVRQSWDSFHTLKEATEHFRRMRRAYCLKKNYDVLL